MLPFSPKFDRGTTGWFLRMTVSSPEPREKKIPACCAGVCAPSPFPQFPHIDKKWYKSKYWCRFLPTEGSGGGGMWVMFGKPLKVKAHRLQD